MKLMMPLKIIGEIITDKEKNDAFFDRIVPYIDEPGVCNSY